MVGYQQKMSSNAKEKIVLRDLLLLFIFVAIMALSIAIAEEVPAHVWIRTNSFINNTIERNMIVNNTVGGTEVHITGGSNIKLNSEHKAGRLRADALQILFIYVKIVPCVFQSPSGRKE
jgi:hypothetical protein